MAKQKFPTNEKIVELKVDFKSELSTINKAEKEGTTSPKKSFLLNISEEIKDAINDGTSYMGIKSAIKKIYSIDISTQLISNFAHNELKIPKKTRGKTPAPAPSNQKTSLEIKKDMTKTNKKSEKEEVTL